MRPRHHLLIVVAIIGMFVAVHFSLKHVTSPQPPMISDFPTDYRTFTFVSSPPSRHTPDVSSVFPFASCRNVTQIVATLWLDHRCIRRCVDACYPVEADVCLDGCLTARCE